MNNRLLELKRAAIKHAQDTVGQDMTRYLDEFTERLTALVIQESIKLFTPQMLHNLQIGNEDKALVLELVHTYQDKIEKHFEVKPY